jgi:hypothetical protein
MKSRSIAGEGAAELAWGAVGTDDVELGAVTAPAAAGAGLLIVAAAAGMDGPALIETEADAGTDVIVDAVADTADADAATIAGSGAADPGCAPEASTAMSGAIAAGGSSSDKGPVSYVGPAVSPIG